MDPMVLLMLAIQSVALASGKEIVSTDVPQAIAAAVRLDGAAFDGKDAELKTIAALTAVFRFEAGPRMRMDTIGDHGLSVCAGQILLPPGKTTPEGWTREILLSEPVACARRTLAMMRESFRACWRSPVDDRLALYARGDCDSVRGRELSRQRMSYAKELARKLRADGVPGVSK